MSVFLPTTFASLLRRLRTSFALSFARRFLSSSCRCSWIGMREVAAVTFVAVALHKEFAITIQQVGLLRMW